MQLDPGQRAGCARLRRRSIRRRSGRNRRRFDHGVQVLRNGARYVRTDFGRLRTHARLRRLPSRTDLRRGPLREPALLWKRPLRHRRDLRDLPGRLRMQRPRLLTRSVLRTELHRQDLRRRRLRRELRARLQQGFFVRRRTMRRHALLRQRVLRTYTEGRLLQLPIRLRVLDGSSLPRVHLLRSSGDLHRQTVRIGRVWRHLRPVRPGRIMLRRALQG
jgi:hypothetical protein